MFPSNRLVVRKKIPGNEKKLPQLKERSVFTEPVES